jgi:starch synthase
MKILHVISECYPLVKTGGLADYGFSLPHALKQHGADVRILLPGYGDVMNSIVDAQPVGHYEIEMAGKLRYFRVLEVLPQGFEVPVWLADCPELFGRPGNPYGDTDGIDWPDNAERYASFSKLAAQLATDEHVPDWRPDVVHCHDWQTGLVPAWIKQKPLSPRCIFTIHNLSYQGLFPYEEFQRLKLPSEWWATDSLEFYGGFSLLKAGLVYADVITTVSRSYAEEILTPEFGQGMDGVLINYRHKLSGIINGIDMHVWDPATDPYLEGHYGIEDREAGREANRDALFRMLDWEPGGEFSRRPLFGSVGRLVEQKGTDLLVGAASHLLSEFDAAFVIVGDGQPEYIEQLQELQKQYPDHVSLYIGYSECLAHLVEAAADFFVMPSRFEPCGLNQLYSMRYGTPPVVHRVGGLADTVTDANAANLASGTATGIVFDQPGVDALYDALLRAIRLHQRPLYWKQVQQTAMQQDFGWHNNAVQYLALYEGAPKRVVSEIGLQDAPAELPAALPDKDTAAVL